MRVHDVRNIEIQAEVLPLPPSLPLVLFSLPHFSVLCPEKFNLAAADTESARNSHRMSLEFK